MLRAIPENKITLINDFRSILDSMIEGVQIISQDWEYIYVNDALVKQSHYTREELIGNTMMEKYPGIEKTEMFNALQHCLYTKQNTTLENEFTYPNGAKGWFELSIQPMGENLFILSVDITRRKLAELELEGRNSQLRSINEELGQFAYIASHDLQEPLRTTASFVQLLEKENRGRLSENSSLYLSHISTSVSRMKMMISGLLEFSDIGRNKETEVCDLNTLLDEVETDIFALVNETGAKIAREKLPVVNGYRIELARLFQNLLINAIKFRRTGVRPEVNITVIRESDYWKFCIQDNGIGIKEAFYDKIFVIYQRLHTKSEYAGSGIGLAHCKKIVELHKGKIWVESEEGKGSRFYFTLKV